MTSKPPENFFIRKFSELILESKNAGMDLELPQRYIIGVQGPNGAGKTTLLRMILGDFDRMQGKIEIDGRDNRKYRTELLQKIGIISNDRQFFETEDDLENEAYFSEFFSG